MGNPLKYLYTHATSGEDYLNQRLNKTEDCWVWLKGVDRDGYGQCQASKYAKLYKVTRAHQLAYVVWNGEIPKDRIICHTCDNPKCCNPNHLYAGTFRDNVHDCMNRGRYISGNKPKNKYSEILEYKDKLTCMDVGKIFNISYSRVCQIWRGEYNVDNYC